MPDVVIWMITGQKRTVYYRIPAYDVLYSSNPDYMGRFCGSVQTINLKVIKVYYLYIQKHGLVLLR